MSELGQFYPDNLIGGDKKLVTESAVILSGQNLKRGTVLGKVTMAVPTTGTADGGNTGNGTVTQVAGRSETLHGVYTLTCVEAITNGGKFQITDPNGNSLGYVYARSFSGTGDGTLTEIKRGRQYKPGIYTAVCSATATNGGTFTVTDPDGVVLGTAVIPAGAGNSVRFVHDQLSFLITDGATDFALNDTFSFDVFDSNQITAIVNDGATDFIVGDFFTVTVTAGAKDCNMVDSGASDGSQNPWAVLAEDMDATTADKRVAVYLEGQFVESQLIFGGDDTVETHRAAMRDLGIIPVVSVRAATNY